MPLPSRSPVGTRATRERRRSSRLRVRAHRQTFQSAAVAPGATRPGADSAEVDGRGLDDLCRAAGGAVVRPVQVRVRDHQVGRRRTPLGQSPRWCAHPRPASRRTADETAVDGRPDALVGLRARDDDPPDTARPPAPLRARCPRTRRRSSSARAPPPRRACQLGDVLPAVAAVRRGCRPSAGSTPPAPARRAPGRRGGGSWRPPHPGDERRRSRRSARRSPAAPSRVVLRVSSSMPPLRRDATPRCTVRCARLGSPCDEHPGRHQGRGLVRARPRRGRVHGVAFVDVDMTELTQPRRCSPSARSRNVRFNVSEHTDSAFVNCRFSRCNFFDATFAPVQAHRQHLRRLRVRPAQGGGRQLVVRRALRRGTAAGPTSTGCGCARPTCRARAARARRSSDATCRRRAFDRRRLQRGQPAGQRPRRHRPADGHAHGTRRSTSARRSRSSRRSGWSSVSRSDRRDARRSDTPATADDSGVILVSGRPPPSPGRA